MQTTFTWITALGTLRLATWLQFSYQTDGGRSWRLQSFRVRSSVLSAAANDSFSGDLVSTARNRGLFGVYDASKTDHIWSMGRRTATAQPERILVICMGYSTNTPTTQLVAPWRGTPSRLV
ncbi:hypothetical protein [Vibrio penaeicida]|uniref:hypothetical protein n=1 Tax=Vibrio penaeicida TaxID=104609 RepID=UPI001CC6E050|nr:hypothetical protein [Vibrio penaeicida]